MKFGLGHENHPEASTGNYRKPHKAPTPTPRKPSGLLNWGLICLLAIMGLGLALNPIMGRWQDYQDAQASLYRAQTEYLQAQEDLERLQAEQALVNHPDYLADIARRDYYYSKPGEIIFRYELPTEDMSP